MQQKSLQMNVFSYFIVLGDRRSQGRCFFMVEKWYTNRPFYVALGGKVEGIWGKWLMKKAHLPLTSNWSQWSRSKWSKSKTDNVKTGTII